jgi:hypothetical protein
MPDLQGSGFDLVVILAFLFVGWYLVGGLWQRRRSAAYVRTLGRAATALAEGGVAPRLSWLGQAGFQLVVDDAVAPFRKLSIVVFLAPREALALWLYALARRRGDTVVLRADLRERPARGTPPGTAAGTVGVREVLLSPESPNLVAVLDPAWVRATPTDDVARSVLAAARSALG